MASTLNPKLLDVVTVPSANGEPALGTGTVVEVYPTSVLVEVSDESGVARNFVTIPNDDVSDVVWRSQSGPTKESHDNAQTLYEEGMMLLQNGLFGAARDKFARSFELYPDGARALHNSTVELAAKGSFDSAIWILRLVVELQPEYSLARENLSKTHLNRGVYHAKRGSLDKAVEDFTNALLLATSTEIETLACRNLAAAHTQIALRHIEIRRFDEALQLFLMAFQLEPSRDTRSNFALALVARSASKNEDRVPLNEESFRQPMLMGLSLSECLNAYGVTLTRLGQVARGKEILIRATTIDPANELVKRNLTILSANDSHVIPDFAIWAAVEPQSTVLHVGR